MTVGKIVVTAVGGLILGLIAGLVTRNIIVAILFPILLIGFLLMWRRIREETPSKPKNEEGERENIITVKKEVEVKVREDQPQGQPQVTPEATPQVQNSILQVDKNPQATLRPSQPPVSTNYPPRQSLR